MTPPNFWSFFYFMPQNWAASVQFDSLTVVFETIT